MSDGERPGRVLIVDDEEMAARNLAYVMGKEGYAVTTAASGKEALTLLEQEPFDLILTDLRMQPVDGLQLLQICRQRWPESEVILITAFASLESAVETMKFGAFYYLAKPYRLEEVRRVVAEALAKVRLKRENQRLKSEIATLRGSTRILTQDLAMERLLETARQVAPTGSTVLITGESGVGKELLARFIHQHSGRDKGPFLAINCGAFTEDLLGNELFGHEKGAFTGAQQSRGGLVEAAEHGTLFLDEVTEMSPAMQVRLLRVVQEREVMRLGGTRARKVNVRFVSATNRDIMALVREGRFRQDLYFRLNVIHLHLPPLAQRRWDIPLLAYHFLNKYATWMNKEVTSIGDEAMERLRAYDFPGNVRELENVIERAVAVCRGKVVETGDLPEEMVRITLPSFRQEENRIPTLEEQERRYIEWVLAESGGNQTKAAQVMGIDRVSLWRKLKRFAPEGGKEGVSR